MCYMLVSMNFTPNHSRCVLQKPDSFEISAEVPGFNKDEVDVSVHDGNVIHIKADHADVTKESDEEVSGMKVDRIERSSGSLFHSFKLPPSADLERLAAKAENGVLNIVVPKKAEAAAAGPRRVPVA